jgi:hypothetical protein
MKPARRNYKYSRLPKLSKDERRLKKNEVFDPETLSKIDRSMEAHPVKLAHPRGRKRFKQSGDNAKDAINLAIEERRKRRLAYLYGETDA